MRLIELDGKNWQTILDFDNALLRALGAPGQHGASIDAMIDSMIWGEVNDVEPPYTIRLVNTAGLPKEIREYIKALREALVEARANRRAQEGHDADVNFEIAS